MARKIEEQEIPATGAKVHEHPRVLVIDDDPAIQTFLVSRLSKFGIDTLYASDAGHGYRMACKERPSVIVTDNYMPNGDAQYLLHRLRSTEATAHIPVFVISGKKLDAVTEQTLRRNICGRPGATQVLMKSFDTGELFDALKKFCAFATRLAPD